MKFNYVTLSPPLSSRPSPVSPPVGLKLTVWSSAVKAHSTLTVLSVSCIMTGFSWMTTWLTYRPRPCRENVLRYFCYFGDNCLNTHRLHWTALSSDWDSETDLSLACPQLETSLRITSGVHSSIELLERKKINWSWFILCFWVRDWYWQPALHLVNFQ